VIALRRIAPAHVALVALVALGAPGCGEPSPTGLGEPLRVRHAVFKPGPLPGTRLPEGSPPPTEGAQVTSIETNTGLIFPHHNGRAIVGRTTTAAFSIAVSLADLGTGYWVLPVGGADPMVGEELTWGMTADFGGDIPPGLHTLRFVALDGRGVAGVQREVPACALPAIPDNLNACDPTLRPPAVVLSLDWDENVDLNLVVVTPDGKVVDARRPSTAGLERGSIPAEVLRRPDTGVLDRDSNAECHIDDIRRENLVWQGDPVPGVYRVYASLFDACNLPSVTLRATVHQARSADEGRTWRVETTWQRRGQLTRLDADGGRTRGLFLGEVALP